MASEVNVQPSHGKAGRHPTRAFLDSLSGHDDPGMFGRMFPDLRPLAVDDGPLQELADAMKDAAPDDAAGDNTKVPAGFTYLGQFVDHDITLDLTSFGDKEDDPKAVRNFRTPALDLDNVYGLGPDGSRHLYARNPGDADGKNPGPKLLIGKNINVPLGGVTGAFRNDLPRSPEGFALIGDHRNDENLLVAQTQLAMLKFHNKICDQLIAAGRPADSIFLEARQTATWHYQWLVLHDFVERITEKGIVAKILEQGRRFYRFKTTPYIPVEFSAAAYRLGHSMVRQTYSYNRVFTEGAITPATLQLLFTFTGLSGGIVGDLAPNPPTGPTPVSALPSNWIIDWRRFHEVLPNNPADVPRNASRKLDPFVVPPLHTLPGGGGSLPFRNLKRGVLVGLPSGQDIAKTMMIKNPLTPAEIAKGPDGAVAKKHGLHEHTPLWYYILKEAEQRGRGERLGPVGATIVSEVFVGLVHGDHQSYLWLRGKDWKPTLPSKTPGDFTMADLLRFVGDVSPIDNIAGV
ncbi:MULTISPECIES: heme peroxidase family protein [Rhodopseudomonas]|uniref:Heme peroxidase n=1 Tax=Rhodopseudomonas palustris TaxID=1076 RepID=A0A0D7EKF4_RHOPL|nr:MULTISPECIES: heme peroxidase family protein [Rhodopseudomonas]KIZ41268.1 heme peroxidase [Rhodopseudomonas palustris]MDF3810605.1 heme peroxidase family protein [Rhodopseudomonas sp. BAL398]WOK16507.1 heme peroxidase family protein [Rhodopseudomonas sp. BAL398]